MINHDRHTAPLTAAEITIFNKILDLLRINEVPHGRAVFMFGSITEGLIEYSVRAHSVPEPEALKDYLQLFAAGIGLEMMKVEHATLEAAEPTKVQH